MSPRMAAAIAAFAVYFPVFAPLYLQPRDLKIGNPLNVAIVLLGVLLYGGVLARLVGARRPPIRVDPNHKPLIALNVYMIIATLVYGLVENEMYEAYRFLNVPLASLLVIAFLYRGGVMERRDEFWRAFGVMIGACFVVQLGLSTYESVTGRLLVQRLVESGNYASLEERDILAVLGTSQRSLLGFRLTLNGLYPQHNYFATLLAVLNVLFITQLLRERRPLYAVLALLVLVGAAGNGSRHGLIAVLAADTIAALKVLSGGSKLRLAFVGGVGAVAVAWLLQPVVADLGRFAAVGLLAFQRRADLWSNAFDYYWNGGPIRLLLGYGIRETLDFGIAFLGVTISTESQHVMQFVTLGLVGLGFFIYVFHVHLATRARRMSLVQGTSDQMLWVSLLICALVSTMIYLSSPYLLITLLYLGVQDREAARPGREAALAPGSSLAPAEAA